MRPLSGRAVVAALLIAGAGGVVGAPAVQATSTAKVSIVPGGGKCTSEFCFRPGHVRIANKGTVTWTNTTMVTHTITRCTPSACSGHGGGTGTASGFGTSGLPSGQQYAFTFNGTGTYLYYCAIHGYAVMHGTVTVG